MSKDKDVSGLGLQGKEIILSDLTVELDKNAPKRVKGDKNGWFDNLIEIFGEGNSAILEKVTVQGGEQAGITVLDKAIAKLSKTITLADNKWGGIEVVSQQGAKVELLEGANIDYHASKEKDNAPVIWIDANELKPDEYVIDPFNILSNAIYVKSDGNPIEGTEVPKQVWFNLEK